MPTQISAFPTPPSTNDPANFNTRADAFLGHLPTFVTETNALASEVAASVVSTATDRAMAADSQAAAQISANNAAAAASFKGLWSSLAGAASMPFSVYYNGFYWLLASNLANVASKTPGVDPEWVRIGLAPMTRRVQNTNATLTINDIGNVVSVTGTSSPTLTLPLAGIGAGTIRVQNEGSGQVTLARSGTNTIDGTTGYILYPGEVRDITSDGAGAYVSTVVKPFAWTLSSSATWQKSPGYSAIGVDLVGGGGGGGGGSVTTNATTLSNDCTGGGGGGGGCRVFAIFNAADLAASVACTLGAGGTAGAGGVSSGGNGTSGGAGGISSFGAMLKAYGGGGGFMGVQNNTGTGSGGGTGGGAADPGAIGVQNVSGNGGAPNVGGGGQGFGNINNLEFGGAGLSTTGSGCAVYGGGAGGSAAVGIGPKPGGSSLFGGVGGGCGGYFSVAGSNGPSASGLKGSFTAGGGATAGGSVSTNVGVLPTAGAAGASFGDGGNGGGVGWSAAGGAGGAGAPGRVMIWGVV